MRHYAKMLLGVAIGNQIRANRQINTNEKKTKRQINEEALDAGPESPALDPRNLNRVESKSKQKRSGL